MSHIFPVPQIVLCLTLYSWSSTPTVMWICTSPIVSCDENLSSMVRNTPGPIPYSYCAQTFLLAIYYRVTKYCFSLVIRAFKTFHIMFIYQSICTHIWANIRVNSIRNICEDNSRLQEHEVALKIRLAQLPIK